MPFPKPLSKLITLKHWLQEPHLTALHNHSGLPSCTDMCSQLWTRTDAKWSRLLYPSNAPETSDHKAQKLIAGASSMLQPWEQVTASSTGKMVSRPLQSLPWSRKTAGVLMWKRELTVVAFLLSAILHIRVQHCSVTKNKWINRHFLFKES